MSVCRPCRPVVAIERRAERGSALVWALFFVALTAGVMVSHSIEMSANRKTMDTRYRRVDLARNVAESGLTEATAYLRKQPTQPVATFAPQLDEQADPPLNETLEPEVGLVREFEVHGNLWGRYEVRKTETFDVSANYGEAPGMVWDVGARGYLYESHDPRRPYNQQPNRIVSVQTIRTEMRGLPIEVPGNSAIVVLDPDQIVMRSGGKIAAATDPAITYNKQGGLVQQVLNALLGANVSGTPIGVPVKNLSIDVQDVFKLREDQLRNLSDVVLSSPSQIYGTVAKDLAVFSPTDLTLAPGRSSLRGRMLLFVKGDLAAQSGNNSDFSGVIYVTGNATLEGPFQFRGTMIVGGTLKVGGSSDMVAIHYDRTAVQELSSSLARYRISRDLRPAANDGAFADATDLQNLDLQVR